MNLDEYKRKRSSSAADIVNKLRESNEKPTTKSFKTDERMWSYTKGVDGNTTAIIRFLPAPSETADIVSAFSYGFKGPTGKWFIENCPSTIGESSPVMNYNAKIIGGRKFDELPEDVKTDIRSRSRKKHFYANILVVKDTAKPDNEGKVFLWRFPKTIYDKIIAANSPEDETEEQLNVFDLFEGANFKLKVKTQKDYVNYDQSTFMEKSALSDEEAERVLSQIYPLDEFTNPKNFKSYSELETKFNQVMGIEDGEVASPREVQRESVAKPTRVAQSAEQKTEGKAKSKPVAKVEKVEEEAEEGAQDIDADDFFSDLN
jgi:hypothetical protein